MPHFNHFASYVMTGLSNSKASMKVMALKCIATLCTVHKEASQKSLEIFKSFLRFIACDCVKGKVSKEILVQAYKTLIQFVLVSILFSESYCFKTIGFL